MRTESEAPVSDGLLRRMDKAAAGRMVRGMLDGAGLTFNEQAKELVISNREAPEYGQLRVSYATGQVMLKKTIWRDLGLLEGYEYEDGTPGRIGTKLILRVLCNDRNNEWHKQCATWLAEHPDLD